MTLDSEADVDPGSAGTVASTWTPHPGQRAVMEYDARFKVLAAGRRWGKTDLAANVAVRRALSDPGATIWWVAPTYQQANDYGFERIVDLLDPALVVGEPKLTAPRQIDLVTGATISFRSAEREDALRGGGVDLLVVDEAGSVPGRAWTEELRPTLSDTLGDLLAIGTPKGRGSWFSRWFDRGQSPDPEDGAVASWRAPTKQNPHVPDSEVDAARRDMPDRVFRQEYLAEFTADGSAVFPGVEAAVGEHTVPVDAREVSGMDDRDVFGIGVDFARQSNYTAIVVLAPDPDGRVIYTERLRHTSWSRIQARVEDVAARYRPATVAVDATRDNKVVEDLATAVPHVAPVSFSASKKTTMVENLITRIEAGDVVLPVDGAAEDSDALLRELRQYEFDTTNRGNVRYHAPEHAHDDMVDALALAVEARRRTGPGTETRRRPRSSADADGPGVTTRGSPHVARSEG